MPEPLHDQTATDVERVQGEIADAPSTPEELEVEVVDDPEAVLVSYDRYQWEAPIPPPGELAEYEKILPGSANRILQMAETASQYQVDRFQGAQRLASKIITRFTLLVLTGFALAGFMVHSGHDITGAVTALATFGASLLSVFRRSRRPSKEPPESEGEEAG